MSDGAKVRAFFHFVYATYSFCIYVFDFVRDLKFLFWFVAVIVWGFFCLFSEGLQGYLLTVTC